MSIREKGKDLPGLDKVCAEPCVYLELIEEVG